MYEQVQLMSNEPSDKKQMYAAEILLLLCYIVVTIAELLESVLSLILSSGSQLWKSNHLI